MSKNFFLFRMTIGNNGMDPLLIDFKKSLELVEKQFTELLLNYNQVVQGIFIKKFSQITDKNLIF